MHSKVKPTIAFSRLSLYENEQKAIGFRSFFLNLSPTYYSSARSKEDSMKTSMTLATLLVALTLAACGGGSSTPSPVPVTDTSAPVLTLTTSSPASVTTTIVFTSDEDLGGNVSITVKNGTATVSGSTSLNPGNRGLTWTPAAALTCNTAYTVNASGTDLAGNSGTATGTVTTTACATSSWWPPATVASVGQKVSGTNVLSGTNVMIGDTTWQAAVKNGTVKFADTGAVMTGFDVRPIAWAVHQYSGSWCAIAVHKDDGSSVGVWTSAGSTCNTEAFDYVIGTQAGLIRHFSGRNQCFELRWNQSALTFTDTQISCP